MKESNCILNSALYGILLNLVLPLILKPFATQQEIKPENGTKNLSYTGQFMHMMVHHSQVPFMSSLIVGLIVGLSVYLNYNFRLLNL
jgi:hypothetical protein